MKEQELKRTNGQTTKHFSEEKKHEGISEVYTYCEYCGKPFMYQKSNGELVRDAIHDKCLRLKKFKHLSVYDKDFQNHIFKNAIIENEKEIEYYQHFKMYVKNFDVMMKEQIGFILSGNPGTGKTFATECIANYLTDKGYAVLNFNISGYLDEIKKGFDKNSPKNDIEDKLLQAVIDADLIIIDDIGSERITEWSSDRLYVLFNKIYTEHKCVILTTNMDGNELSKHLEVNKSDKVIDRLTQSLKCFVFDWESKRKKIGEEKFNRLFQNIKNKGE